jgi:hypothetical protein
MDPELSIFQRIPVKKPNSSLEPECFWQDNIIGRFDYYIALGYTEDVAGVCLCYKKVVFNNEKLATC